MDPLPALATLRRIAQRHGLAQPASCLAQLLSTARSEPDSIWQAINSNEVWGGAGSLADVSLSAGSTLPESEVRSDELLWRNSFIALHAGMLANGAVNPRAQSCVAAFEAWNAAHIGI